MPQLTKSEYRARRWVADAALLRCDPDYRTVIVPVGVMTADWQSVLTREPVSAGPELWYDPVYSCYWGMPQTRVYTMLQNHLLFKWTNARTYWDSCRLLRDNTYQECGAVGRAIKDSVRPILGQDPASVVEGFLRPSIIDVSRFIEL